MIKKVYEAPIIKKVHLEITTAVLSVCHSSLIEDSSTAPTGCRVVGSCWENAPGIPEPIQ